MTNVAVHINRPSSTRFVARVRARGNRKYTVLGKPTKRLEPALRRVATAMGRTWVWKRGDVLMVADYYDPVLMAEIIRQ